MSQTQLPRGFVGKGSAATLTGQGAKILLQLASTAVLGRLLVPADFGLMGMVAPLLTFFVIFRDLGLSSVAIQRSSLSSLDTTNLFWINLGAGCILAVVVAALGPASAAPIHDGSTGDSERRSGFDRRTVVRRQAGRAEPEFL